MDSLPVMSKMSRVRRGGDKSMRNFPMRFLLQLMFMMNCGLLSAAEPAPTPQVVTREQITNRWHQVRIEDLRRAAENGDATAQFYLGWKLAHGVGMPADDKARSAWYRKAAEQGLAVAQSDLGWLHYEGR